MKLSMLAESSVGWVGPIKAIFGSSQPYTLNYGTNGHGRPPFLYVPIPLSVIRSSIRHLAKATAWYDPSQTLGGISYEQVNHMPGMIIIPDIGRKLSHVGEAHLTVSMGPELFNTNPTSNLPKLGICGPGYGIPVEINHTGQFKVMQSLYYKDENDPDGPLLIAEAVQVPSLGKIRQAIGLSAVPALPAQIKSKYVPHITIGYAANVNSIQADYMAHNHERGNKRI